MLCRRNQDTQHGAPTQCHPSNLHLVCDYTVEWKEDEGNELQMIFLEATWSILECHPIIFIREFKRATKILARNTSTLDRDSKPGGNYRKETGVRNNKNY
jgi:hypothetical protein